MKKLAAIIFLVGLFTASCEKEFLDRIPRDSISTESFFKTEDDLILYTNGLLSMPSGYSLYLGDQSSDNAATTGAVEVKTILTGNPTSQTLTSGWDWGRLRDINFFLDNYAGAGVSDEIKNHYAGLARLYRAQFYYEKVKRYSDVPWYDKVISTADQDLLYKAQDPRATVVENIMADLDFAAANIRENVPTGTPDKWVAMMWKARIALHEGTFRKYHPELNLESTANSFLEVAKNTARQIMDSGRFQLHNTGNPDSDYHDLFVSTNLTGNPEIIQANIYDWSKGRLAGYRYEIQGYEQSPSRDLVQTYLMKDGSRFTEKPNYLTLLFVEEFANRDSRLAQTLAYPGWINIAEGQSLPYVQELNKNFTGYNQIKGYVNSTNPAEYESVDIPVMRYAETLLIYAEAAAELGQITQADLDISVNQLRNRVGMPSLSLGSANASPDPVLVAQYPNVSGANLGAILEIRRERRVELALEGYRFDDLMRYAAGERLERNPVGMFFPGLGKYDMTGDGVEDLILIDKSTDIPDGDNKETNALGEKLVYYKTGFIDESVTVYLENGANGGQVVTEKTERVFTAPRDYYRPIPFNELILNPNLKQPFNWN